MSSVIAVGRHTFQPPQTSSTQQHRRTVTSSAQIPHASKCFTSRCHRLPASNRSTHEHASCTVRPSRNSFALGGSRCSQCITWWWLRFHAQVGAKLLHLLQGMGGQSHGQGSIVKLATFLAAAAVHDSWLRAHDLHDVSRRCKSCDGDMYWSLQADHRTNRQAGAVELMEDANRWCLVQQSNMYMPPKHYDAVLWCTAGQWRTWQADLPKLRPPC
jgi:hypothetical protein